MKFAVLPLLLLALGCSALGSACSTPAAAPTGGSGGRRPAGTWTMARRDTIPPERPAPYLDPARAARAAHARANEERTTAGLRTLGWSDSLAAVARTHSADMARRGYFDHASPEGRRVNDRAGEAGLACRIVDGNAVYTGFGENLFVTARYRSGYRVFENGRTSYRYDWKPPDVLPTEAVAGWMRSPGHRANLLNGLFRREGIGVAVSADGRVYFTQVFC